MFPFAAASVRPAPHRPVGDATSAVPGASALRGAGDRVTLALVKSLQAMAGQVTPVEGVLVGLTGTTVREYLTSVRADTVAGAISCTTPACNLLAVLDSTLVHAVVELMAGGNGAEPMPAIPRATTAIDNQFAQIVVTLTAAAIDKEWAAHGFAAARVMRLDGGVSADLLGARGDSVAVMSCELSLFGRRGLLTLALPAAALAPFAEDDENDDHAPATASDPAWNAVLRREIGLAPVRVDAMLEASQLALGAIAALRPGQVITIPPTARNRVALISDGRTIFRGELGQDDSEHYCLRVDTVMADAANTLTHINAASDRRRGAAVVAKVSPMEQPTKAAPTVPLAGGAHLDSIMRIPVSVQVFLGSASMPIADLMQLDRGSVVTLDHAVSDPVDVVVNGRVIARGELIALDDDPTRIGVKLIEIVGNPEASA